MFMGGSHDIDLYQKILFEKFNRLRRVSENPPDAGGSQQEIFGEGLREEFVCLNWIGQIAINLIQGDQPIKTVSLQTAHYRGANHAGRAGNTNTTVGFHNQLAS
jgi:hypothetical protein